jgi:transcriptional regulator with XRE-family HTH domain
MKKRHIQERQPDGFGWRLMEQRKQRGLSLADVSDTLKERGICISAQSLSALECGRTMRVRVDLLNALTDVLQADVAVLVKGEPDHVAA